MRIIPANVWRTALINKGGIKAMTNLETNHVVPHPIDIIAKAQYAFRVFCKAQRTDKLYHSGKLLNVFYSATESPKQSVYLFRIRKINKK